MYWNKNHENIRLKNNWVNLGHKVFSALKQVSWKKTQDRIENEKRNKVKKKRNDYDQELWPSFRRIQNNSSHIFSEKQQLEKGC